jgi:hypothetical protein
MAPTIGPPRGVLPMNAIDQSAIVRPRKLGSLASWMVELPVARKLTLAPPTRHIATTATARSGESAATSIAAANASAVRTRGLSPVPPPRAAARPPRIAPIPMAEVTTA